MKRIDPIKVREAKERMQRRRDAISRGEKGAAGLLWFKEHAVQKDHPDRFRPDVLDPKRLAIIVASQTPDAKIAQDYVDRAALTFRDAILEKAVAIAQADFDSEDCRDE